MAIELAAVQDETSHFHRFSAVFMHFSCIFMHFLQVFVGVLSVSCSPSPLWSHALLLSGATEPDLQTCNTLLARSPWPQALLLLEHMASRLSEKHFLDPRSLQRWRPTLGATRYMIETYRKTLEITGNRQDEI